MMSSQTPHTKASVSPSSSPTTKIPLRSTPYHGPTRSSSPAHGPFSTKDYNASNTTPATPSSSDRATDAHLLFSQTKHLQPLPDTTYDYLPHISTPDFDIYDPVTGSVVNVDKARSIWESGLDLEKSVWNGYVQYPESDERSSLKREAEKDRQTRDGDVRS
jgi:hypothetical protein